ncbi:MAG TPA: hypothetical protein VFG07_03970 [Thermoplasmata archaeon]|nr:hypothetical protein [Thermoplasmata archaeon]
MLGGAVEDALGYGVAPGEDRIAAALLRRGYDAGIPYFDAGAAGSAAIAEEVIALAFGPHAEGVDVSTTLSGDASVAPLPLPGSADPGRTGRDHGTPFGPDPRSWADDAESAIDRSVRRLRRNHLAIAWVEAHHVPVLREASVRERLDGDSRVGSWGIRFGEQVPRPDAVLGLLALGVRSFGIPYHLLNAPLVEPLLGLIHDAGGSVIDLDPHAGGRLNGDRFSGALGRSRSTPPRPVDFATLRSELEPVTRLGFLTEGKVRTLGQAAIQYVLGSAAVTSAVVPLHDPLRLSEWVEAPGRRSISPEERKAVARLHAGSEAASRAGT